MKKIALISEHASPLAMLGGTDSGGQNVYVAHLARQLARMGYLVDVFTRHDHEGQERIVEWESNVRVINVPAGPACWIPKEEMLPCMDEFARFMLRFAREEPQPYALAHANFFMSGMVALELKRKLGLPFVMTFHALGRVRRQCQGAADAFPDVRFTIEEELMREAERIIAECPQDKADMQQLYLADPQRIDIAPCGFDPEEFGPVLSDVRAQLDLEPNEFVILQLGRMVPRKGVDNVIHALALLRHVHGTRARLLIVGGNSETARRMTEEMDQIFERFVGRPIAARFGQGQGGMAGKWMPQVEVIQQEDALLVCADLPGIKREDVQVEVLHDRLLLEGERHEESRGTVREGYRRSERCYGRFYRMIPLPHGVDPDQAKARLQDGVLEVRIPMPGAARAARRVDIG